MTTTMTFPEPDQEPGISLLPLPLPLPLPFDAEYREGLNPEVISEIERLVGVVSDLQNAAHARSTVASYTKQWNRFAKWWSDRDLPLTLPVSVDRVMVYVAAWVSSETPPSNGSITQALAAIDWVHSKNGFSPPRSTELARLRKGVRNELGIAPKRKAAPLLLEHLIPVAGYLLNPTRSQVRDALVITLRASGLSYGQIIRLTFSDLVDIEPRHVTLRLDGEERQFLRTTEPTCVASLLEHWLTVRGDWEGSLLCRITTQEQLERKALPVQTVRSIILKWARRADVELTSGTTLEHHDAIELVTAALQPRPSTVRTMACIWLLWAAALRSDELVRVRIGHLTFDPSGMDLKIPKSKTDQEGKGLAAYVPRGTRLETDVVGAVERWINLLRTAGATNETFICCSIDRYETLCLVETTSDGTIRPAQPLHGQVVSEMVRSALRRAEIEGLEVSEFSSHSGRRGIATQLARNNVGIEGIAAATRHKSLQSAKGYVEEQERRTTSALLGLDL